jgi:undecaprenyl-diphosphatase
MRTDARQHRHSLLTAALTGLAAFALTAELVRRNGMIGLDRPLLDLFEGFYGVRAAYEGLKLAVWATIGAGALVSLAIPTFLCRRRLFREALFWTLAVGGILLTDPLLKELFRREPLVGNDEYSFPSGNAMAAAGMVAAGALLLAGTRWSRPVVVLGACAAGLEGIAVVALFWHYPSDVIAGWAFALGWVCSLALLLGMPRAPIRKSPRKRDGARAKTVLD